MGPPGINKTELAISLSDQLGCYYINPFHVLLTNLKLQTKTGIQAANNLGLSPETNEADIISVKIYISSDVV